MTHLHRRLDMNDRMLVNGLGPLGEQVAAIPVAPDVADGTFAARGLRFAFEDAWARYTLIPASGTSGTSGTESRGEPLEQLRLEPRP